MLTFLHTPLPSEKQAGHPQYDTTKSIVTKPFSWLTSGSAGPSSQPTRSPDGSLTALTRISNLKIKRRPSSPDSSDTEPLPKKRRRGSPNSILAVGQGNSAALGFSASVPLLSSQSAALRPHRAAFLPPLPRTSAPSRQGSIELTRFTSPAFRMSPSVGNTVFAGRVTSITPQTSLDEGTDRTAFGLRYRSPFMPRASPAPPMNSRGPHGLSLSRQSSTLSERGRSTLLGHLSKPRTALAVGDHESGRIDSDSPTHPNLSPAASPIRRLSDSVEQSARAATSVCDTQVHGRCGISGMKQR